MLVSVNRNIINKNEMGADLAVGFVNKDLDQWELAEEIRNGYAFSTQHRERRAAKNFLAGGYIGLDFDRTTQEELEQILADPIVRDYYGIFYYTFSSTDEQPKFRIIFELDEPITDADEYRKTVGAFIFKFAAGVDSSCSDPARLFYGARGKWQKATGNILPKGVLQRVVAEYQTVLDNEERIRQEAETARRENLRFDGDNNRGKKAFLDKVIERHVDRIRNARHGERHPVFIRSARVFGGYLAGEPEVADEYTMRTALERAYMSHKDYSKRDMDNAIKWGFDSGRSQPIYIPALPEKKTSTPPPNVDPETGEINDLNADLSDYPPDDDGNADAFVSIWGKDFLYCEAYGWLRWADTHWTTELAEEILTERVTEVLRSRRAAAAMLGIEAVVKACKPSRAVVVNCIFFLRVKLVTLVSTFDDLPHLLNCANGVLNLKTGEMTPHNREQRYTYCLSTRYNPGANSPLWLEYLNSVVGGGQEVIDYLQEALGYTLTGETREEIMFYLYGPSRSGKGTLTELLLNILGRPLASEADFNTFTARRDGDSSNFDLAPLKPARAILASESNSYQRLNPAKIKQLTGGNEVRCCFKHKDFFNYRPQYKIWLSSNQQASGDPDDDALWGRIKVIEFPNSFLGGEDKSLKIKLRSAENRETALAWMVEGARRWYALGTSGLKTPLHITSNTTGHRNAADYTQDWLDECCITDETKWQSNADIMDSYRSWCLANNVEPKQSRGLANALKAKGFAVGVQRKTNGLNSKGVQGLQIVSSITPHY